MTNPQPSCEPRGLRPILPVAVALLAGGFLLLGSGASGVTGILGIAGLWAYWRSHLHPIRSRFTTCIVVSIVVYILSGLLSLAVHPSDSANLDQFLMRLAYLWFLPLASIIALLPASRIVRAVETGACLGALGAGLIAIVELLYLRERAWGNAGNPGPYALIASVQYAICVLAIGCRGPGGKAFFAAGAGAAAWCVYASGMRSFFPVIFVFPIAALSLAIIRTLWKKRFGTGLAYISVLAMVAAALLFVAMKHERIWALQHEFNLLLSGIPNNTSLGHRLAMLLYVKEHFRDAWPLGTGQSAALAGMKEFVSTNYGFTLGKTHLHNIFVTAYFRGGIPELIATAFFLLSLPVSGLVQYLSGGAKFNWKFASAVWLPYFLGSQLNLALGHDMLDHFLVYMLAVIAATSGSKDLRKIE